MDTIRKRPAPSPEQCDAPQETNGVVQQDPLARPLDLLFPVDGSVPQVSEHASTDDERANWSVDAPLLRRITSKPRNRSAPAPVGAPDWSLSVGAAVVLLGFAIAFGTYVTLTQRDEMQSSLRRIVNENELRAMPRHDRPTITERTQELARTLLNQIETLRSRDVVDAAAVAGAAATQQADAHSSTLASSAPTLPTQNAPAVPAKSGKPPAKQLAARPVAPPLPQPAPRAHQVANTTPSRSHAPTRVTTVAHQEHRTVAKQANTTCSTHATCQQARAQNAHGPLKTASHTPGKTTPKKPGMRTVAAHSTTPKAPPKPAPRTTPSYTIQAYSPPDRPEPAAASDDGQIYRQH